MIDNSQMVSRWTHTELMAEELEWQLRVPRGKQCFVGKPVDSKSGHCALLGSARIEADGNNLAFEQYQHGLAHEECKGRAEKCKKSLTRQASFLLLLSLRHLRGEDLTVKAQEPLPLGVYLEYIYSSRYLVLTGNRGTRKPHPALGQRTHSGSEGSLVLFIMVLRMLPRTSKIRSEKSISKRGKSFAKNDPTTCDEFVDTASDKNGPKLPYNRRSLMIARKSMIRTTTLSFDRWYEIFRAPVLPAVMIDRLIGLVFIIIMTGQRSSIKKTGK